MLRQNAPSEASDDLGFERSSPIGSNPARREVIALSGALLAGLAARPSAAAAEPLRQAAEEAIPLEQLKAAQNRANGSPGPRTVPAKVLPVPTADVSPESQKLIAAQYSSLIDWDLNPPDAEGWRRVVAQNAAAAEPRLARARERLGVTLEETRLGGVRCFVLTPRAISTARRNQFVVNLHGGGYVYSPGASGTAEAMLTAAYGGYRVIAVDYRMPPDAPFPAALDDAVAVWRELVRTYRPRRVAIGGTSAGGGLVLATIHRAKQQGLPMPGAIAPCTPWADMTPTGDSYKVNEWVDNVLVSASGYAERAARLYANGHDLRDPMLSPINGDFAGFPPTIITTGTRDLFLSNAVRTHRKLRRAKVEAALHVYEGMSHAQFLFNPAMPETREIFVEISQFFDRFLET